MPAPTFVASYGPAAWNGTATTLTTSVTVAAGDTLVVYAAASDGTSHTISGGGLTYTFRAGETNTASVEMWTAPCPSGQTFTLSVSKGSATAGQHGFRALRFANVASLGAATDGFDSIGEPQLTLTTTSTDSTLVYVSADAALSAGTPVYDNPTGGSSFTILDQNSETQYATFGGYWFQSGATGSKTVGMTNPPDQIWSAAVLEVIGTGTQPSGSVTGTLSLSGTANAQGITGGTPTFVNSYGPANWTTSTDTITASVTVAAGDMLVVYSGIHNTALYHTSISGGGLTYTKRVEITGGTTSWCSSEIWTAPCSSAQTFTLSLTKPTGTQLHGFRALRFSNVSSIGNVASGSASGSTPSISLTLAGNASAAVMFSTDWNGVTGARTFRQPTGSTAFVEVDYYQAATWMLSGGYYPDAGSTGANTIGLSAPAAQKWTATAVELVGGSSTINAAYATGSLSLSGTAGAAGQTNAVTATGSITINGLAGGSTTTGSTHYILSLPSAIPTTYNFSYSDNSTSRMTEALTIRPSDGRVHVIASAGRIWLAPASLSTSATNSFTSSTQLTVTGDVTGASWHPDGNSIAVITRSENIYIFNTSWVQQAVYTVPQAGGNTEAICWSADGTKLYFCYDNSAMTGSALYSMVPGSAAVLIGTLPAAFSQCSGLTASPTKANTLYGIHDYSSGGDNTVYEIDATNATIRDEHEVIGATNFDWEDIEFYNGSIWIGDHGNFGGAATLGRGTHQLYKISEPGNGTWIAQQVVIF